MKINELDVFLQTQGSFSVIKLHGFLTAINSSPELIMPSQWLALCGIQGIDFESTKQAKHILGGVMLLYNNINKSLRKNDYKPLLYLPSPSIKEEPLLKEIIDNVKSWAEGYWLGVEKTWPNEGNNKFDPALNGPLGIICHLILPKEEALKEWHAISKQLIVNL